MKRHSVALFIVTKAGISSSIGECIYELWYIHSVENLAMIKKKSRKSQKKSMNLKYIY